jgi:peptidoglycan hydrolase-like protein with peptidoglycan-binding domain
VKWALGAGALGIVVLALVAIGPGGGSDASEQHAGSPPALATVEKGRLASQVNGTGTLGYAARPDGTPYSVVNQAAGAYTELPSAGDVIDCGKPLYRVEDEPVALLCGETPLYRRLSEGARGADVRELNRNLVDLGYAKRSELAGSRRYFGPATADAVAELQDALGLAENGSLEPGQAVFLPGPLRITRVDATLGTMAQPGSPLAQATSTRRRVQVDLDASRAGEVEVGDRARITLPDNSTATGTVTRIGTVAGGGAGGSGSAGAADSGSATIPVDIALGHSKAIGTIDEAPVQVEITTGHVKDALSVPVTALLARAGGGYDVEVVGQGGERELVPVRLGAFDQANGLVQVSGSGLEAGQRVVVPAT